MAHDLQYSAIAAVPLHIHDRYRGVGCQSATCNTSNPDNANIAAVVQGADLHLQRPIRINLRHWHFVDNSLKQRLHIGGHVFVVIAGNTLNRGGEDHRKVELLLGRTEAIK